MQRRSFLKRGVLGSALLLVAGGGLVALLPGDRSAKLPEKLFSISAKAFPVLVAVAARVLVGTTASPLEIAARVDASLRYAPPETRADLTSALLLLENALTGLLLRGKPTPFTELDEAEQDAALKGWRDSRILLLRSAYQGLRKLCLASHYATPAGWPDTGYPGPSIPKPEPAPISARGALHSDANEAPATPLPEGTKP